MTEHRYWLDCGLPDLATSAVSWLEHSHEDDDPVIDTDKFSDTFKGLFERQLYSKPRGYLGLSATGYCQRKNVYQGLGYEKEPVNARSRINFFQGDMTELYWVAAAINAGWDIKHTLFSPEDQLSVYFETRTGEVVGHPDGIIDLDPYKIVVEVKSMKDWNFANRYNKANIQKIIDDKGVMRVEPDSEEWDSPNPWDSHIIQTHAYAFALDRMYPDKKIQILYLAVDKNSGWAKCCKIPLMEELYHEIKMEWDQTMQFIEEENIPARPEGVEEKLADGASEIVWPCGYCGYYKTCLSKWKPKRKVDQKKGSLSIKLGG